MNGILRNGCMVEKTYSVKDLIKALEKFPPETPVVGAWDSMFFPVNCVKGNVEKKAYDDVFVFIDVSKDGCFCDED